jgi:phage head maturation protease
VAGDPLEKLLGGSGDAAPEDDAASDVLAAVKAGDAKALSLALKRHYEACAGAEPDADDEDDEEEEI